MANSNGESVLDQPVQGPIKMRNPGMLLDVSIGPGARFEQLVPAGWTAFCYVHGGAGLISGESVKREQAVVLAPGDYFSAEG